MFWGIFIIIMILIYLSRVRRPTLFTSNKNIKQIALRYIFPMIILNSGIIQSAIQHLFFIYILSGTIKTIIKLKTNDGGNIIVEKFENKTFSKYYSSKYKLIKVICEFLYRLLGWYNGRKSIMNKSKKKDTNIIVLHGLNGSSDSKYVIHTTNLFLRKGCRVFCLNARGMKCEFKGVGFTHFGHTEDLKSLTNYILTNYAGEIFYVGFSQGANICTKFMGEFKNNRIKGGVSVCNPFNLLKIQDIINSGSFINKVGHWIVYINFKMYLEQILKEKIQAESFNELFQILIDKKILLYNSVDEFLIANSSEFYIEHIDKPWLFINADDDPVVPVEIIPKETIFDNENTGLITLQGGHLGFKSFFMTSTLYSIIDEFYGLL